MIKGILIDLGKTVLDNKGFDFEKSYLALYEKTDKSCTFSEFKRVESILHEITFKNAKKTNTEVRLTEFIDCLLKITNLQSNLNLYELEEVFLNEITRYEGLIEGIKEFLEEMNKKGVLVIAVSNSCISSIALRKELDRLEVPYISKVISSADLLFSKPDGRIFEEGVEAMKEMNKDIKRDEIVYLGNDYNCDIIGGSKANLKTIWFNQNGEPDYLHLANYNVKSYKELLDKLNEEFN